MLADAAISVLIFVGRLPAEVTATISMLRPGGTLKDCGTKGRAERDVHGAAQYISHICCTPHPDSCTCISLLVHQMHSSKRSYQRVQLDTDMTSTPPAMLNY